jgi:adenylate cyclase
MIRVASGTKDIMIRSSDAGVRSVSVRGFSVPTDRNGQLWIHFSHHDPARFVSAADVLRGRTGSSRVAGHLAIIGSSATAIRGTNSTPVDAAVPGVEIMAQAIENMLTGTMLTRPSYAITVELFLILAIGIVLGIRCRSYRLGR